MSALPRTCFAALLLFLPEGAPLAEVRVPHDVPAGELTLRFLEDPETDYIDTLQILHGTRVLYEGIFESPLWMLNEPPGSADGILPLGLAPDVTGDGKPDLVLQSFSGGAHCCYYTLIFERSPRLTLLAELSGGHSPVLLEQRDEGPALEAVLRDWTFAYWKAGFADSPAPEVVLTLTEDGYVGAPALMHRPAPSAEELARLAGEVNRLLLQDARLSSALWGPMLDLIYSGNAATAFALVDEAWPAAWPGKNAFLVQFGAQLSFSPFWDTLVTLNDWSRDF